MMINRITKGGIFLIVIFALIISFSCSKNNNENSTTTNIVSIPNSNNNIRTIELTNDDGNITEFWEYNTDSKSLNLVKSVVDGEIDTSKIALKLVSGDFTDTTIVEGKGGVGFTLQFDNDSSGSYSFVVDSPIGKIKGNGAFIIKGAISITSSKADTTSKYDKIVGDYYFSEMGEQTNLSVSFGFKIQKDSKTELKFIPYNYTDNNPGEGDFVLSIDGDRYMLIDKVTDTVLDLTYSNGVFNGTINFGEGAYSATLSKVGAKTAQTPTNNSQAHVSAIPKLRCEIRATIKSIFGGQVALVCWDIYSYAKKHKNENQVEVSIYFDGLEDKYGNEIKGEDRLNGSFVVDLEEARKYKDKDSYAYENKTMVMINILAGRYGHLFR